MIGETRVHTESVIRVRENLGASSLKKHDVQSQKSPPDTAKRQRPVLSVRIAAARADDPLYEAPQCEQWGEGLQGRMHCVPWKRWKRRAADEYGLYAAGYVARLYEMRSDDARGEFGVEGSDHPWRTKPRIFADRKSVV